MTSAARWLYIDAKVQGGGLHCAKQARPGFRLALRLFGFRPTMLAILACRYMYTSIGT